MKKPLITLACIAFSIVPLFAQLYYPGTGTGSGALPPSGSGNTFFGNYSGNVTSTGKENVFFGDSAGLKNTTGSLNTFIGYATGANNTTGGSNTFTGHFAGVTNTAGNSNTFTGYHAGRLNTTGSANSFYGNECGINNTTGLRNSFFGFRCGYNNKVGFGNTFTGWQSGYSNTGDYNSFFGTESGLTNSTGARNSFFGFQAGYGNLTGSGNTFTGYTSGAANTASNNSFYGSESGAANTSGTSNSFFGFQAGLANTTGYSNTLIGHKSGKAVAVTANNTFMGFESGLNTTNGANTFIGSQAGLSNTTGIGNTFIGLYTGGSNATGSYNSCLGYLARIDDNVSYSTGIGHLAYVSTDYTIGLGNPTSSTPVTVLIGQDAKTSGYVLEINGSAYAGSGPGVWTPSDIQFKKNIENYTNAMAVINQLHPVKYYYKDDVYFPREKEDDGKPVKRNFEQEEQIGFIAQELEQVLPNMVRTDKNGFKAVSYDKLFGVLTQGIKEQDVKITSLEIQNKELREKLEAVNALLLSNKTTGNHTYAARSDAADVKMNGAISSVTPNPFSSSTTINYVIPENFKQASLSVVSESGIQAAQIGIKESGNGMFVFVGETLKTGSYYCYLTINGVIVDYKKIVLTK